MLKRDKSIKMGKTKRLSKITIGFGVYIVISAAFMLQVRNWLFKVLGNFVVINSFVSFFILIFAITLIYAFRMRLNSFDICAISVIFVLGYLLIMRQEYFSEKTHVLTYGLLGYLAANDLSDTGRAPQLKNTALAAIFVSFISASDEIFQGMLPYRFAEMKDFITNIISAALGMLLLRVFNK